jgi:RNA polymerase sigma-70 factor (ECF subfamily)
VSVGDEQRVAERFEEHRPRLVAIASQLLGPAGSADDVVQEAWTRLRTAGAADDDGGRLTTLVGRACLRLLNRRPASREEHSDDGDVLLTSLAPAERVAFVLDDLVGMPLEEIAGILGRSPRATRQLAGRARRQVQSPQWTLDADRTVQSRVVDAFLAACTAGDLEELVWLLHADAELHADAAAVEAGGVAETHGAQEVAETFAGVARSARGVLLDGFPAAVRSDGGRPDMVFGFTVVDGRVAEIELLADPDVLPLLDLGPYTP